MLGHGPAKSSCFLITSSFLEGKGAYLAGISELKPWLSQANKQSLTRCKNHKSKHPESSTGLVQWKSVCAAPGRGRLHAEQTKCSPRQGWLHAGEQTKCSPRQGRLHAGEQTKCSPRQGRLHAGEQRSLFSLKWKTTYKTCTLKNYATEWRECEDWMKRQSMVMDLLKFRFFPNWSTDSM